MRTWSATPTIAGRDQGAEDPRAAAILERLEPEPEPRSLTGRAADYTMLVAVFAAPMYGKGIGGLTGIAYSDILLGLAGLARGLHLVTSRVRLHSLRRHSFLLGMLGLFAALGLLSGFMNGTNPLAWGFVRLVIGSLGSVFLVATYGDMGTTRARRELLTAFGFGCIVLSLTSFTGLQLQGRALGWSVHPNALGHSLMMGTATCAWQWDNSRKLLHRLFWAGGVLLCLAGIMNSGSRGALLGIFVGGFAYLALRGNRRLTLFAILAALFLSLSVAGGVVHLPANNPLTRLLEQNQKGSTGAYSDQQRSALFKSDVARIDAHPWFGDGFGDIVNVHVAYLQGWVAAGAMAGLDTMVIGFAALWLPLVTRRRDLALACVAAAIATAWTFTNIYTARDQWLFMALAFSSAQSISVLGPRRRELLAAADQEA
jgi:hypothetical protein